MPGERVLIAIVAVLFLILHIAAGSILQRAEPDQSAPARQDAQMALYD
ncbi:hypothetical protein [Bradyrhizobium sp.]